jgi:hypothetical protein
MVVYRPEHLFGRYEETRHLPDGHFKVHLRELEESLEETRHTRGISPRRRRRRRRRRSYAAEGRRGGGVLPREGYVRIHDDVLGWK